MLGMNKHDAIILLGGTPKSAAKAIGITVQAISGWPEVLSDPIRDRVEAAYHRLHGAKLPKLNLQTKQDKEL